MAMTFDITETFQALADQGFVYNIASLISSVLAVAGLATIALLQQTSKRSERAGLRTDHITLSAIQSFISLT